MLNKAIYGIVAGMLSLNLQAAPHTKTKMEKVDVAAFTSHLQDDQFYNKFLKDSITKKRNVAQSIVDVPAIENTFDADFKELRNELLNTKVENDPTGEKAVAEFNRIIVKWTEQKKFETLGHQTQFLVMQLKALKPYKSIIYRAREYAGKYSFVRASMVTMLRTQISGIQAFYPQQGSNVNHWEVVFNYLTMPQPGMGAEITNDTEYYNFLTQINREAVALTNDFNAWVAQGKAIWWDNKILLPFASFTSEKDRYVKLGAPEQYAMLSGMFLNLSGLYSVTAYSMDGFQDLLKSIGKKFGIASTGVDVNTMNVSAATTLITGIDGISAKERFAMLSSKPNLFVLMPDGKIRMQYSYEALKSAARAARISWEETKKLGPNEENLFDPRAIQPFSRILGASFENVDTLFQGQGAQSSLLGGEVIKLDISAFFNNPPQRLSELYPVKFVDGPKSLSTNVNGEKVKFRNYKDGMASDWNYSVYKKYFPEIKSNDGKTTTEVSRYARILSQTWGTAPFALPMATVLF